MRSGRATFSTQVMESKSVECWKTIAHFLRTGYIRSSSLRRDLLAVEPDLPAVGIEQADEVLDEHALADARRADDEEHLAIVDVEPHVVEDGLGAEGLPDVAKLDHGAEAARLPQPGASRSVLPPTISGVLHAVELGKLGVQVRVALGTG